MNTHEPVRVAIKEAVDKLAGFKISQIYGMADSSDCREMADDFNEVVAHIFLPVLEAMTARIDTETGTDVEDMVSVVQDQLGDALGTMEKTAEQMAEHEHSQAMRSRRA